MKAKLQIINYSDKRSSFEAYHKNGDLHLRDVGFSCLDNVWKFAPDGVTDITGFPASGKTEFAFELLFYQAEEYGSKFYLYVPDVGGYNEIRRKLVTKYFRRKFRGENGVQSHELALSSAWIDEHFKIITKATPTDVIGPKDLWDFTANSSGISGLLIDSWKNLYHDYTGREDLYLDYILSYRNELAETAQRHFITIAHPTKTEITEGGKRRVPNAFDIKGGPAWFANGKTLITVDKPDNESSLVDIYFTKVKPDTLGKVCTLIGCLEFWHNKSRYVENYNHQTCFAGDAKKILSKTCTSDNEPLSTTPF